MTNKEEINYRTIRVPDDVFAELNHEKRGDETWGDALRRMCRATTADPLFDHPDDMSKREYLGVRS